MTGRPLSVLIVDDDAVVRTWARLSIQHSEFRVAGEASTASEAIEAVQRRRPDLLLVDYRLGDGVGIELVKELRRAGVGAPAVLMTANAEEGLNEAARAAGVQATVLKTGKPDELLDVLRATAAGAGAFDWRHPRRSRGAGALSPREREVLTLVAAGETNRAIAERLGVGDQTVKTIVARVFAKLNVRKRAEAVAAAHKQGLL
jgi:DNA-binding NarL/FixJ family response regulator